MDYFAIQFMKKQEEKRKNSIRNNEIFSLNQQCQRFLVQYHSKLNLLEKEESIIRKINRSLVQSSILRLQYRNNFESLEVLAIQVELLKFLKNKYTDISINGLVPFLQRKPFMTDSEFQRDLKKWQRILEKEGN